MSAMTPLMNEWPTRVRTGTPPRSRTISGTALEQIRLYRMVAPGCLASIAAATSAVVVDPDTGFPRSSTRKQRSASPSNARPTSAPVSQDPALQGDEVLGLDRIGRVVGERPVQLAEEDLEGEGQSVEDGGDDQAAHPVGGVGDDLEGPQGAQVDERSDLGRVVAEDVARLDAAGRG